MTATSSSLTPSLAYSSAPPRVRYKLDLPVGSTPLTFVVGDEVDIAGWAFDERANECLASLALERVSAQPGVVTPLTVERCARDDVANHFATDRLRMSGFTSRFRIEPRWAGQHTIRLLYSEDRAAASAIDLFSFTVVPAAYETTVRRDLAVKFLTGAGLEIGALQRRLDVPVYCRVTYIDRLPLQDLLTHYPELRGQPIQPPDLIDDGETLGKVGAATQSFVIANHFLEHCENPIQTLLNFARVLAADGILYMAVPDKRYTFDVERPVTPYPVLADTCRTGRRDGREVLYREWAQYVNHVPAWEIDDAVRALMADQYSIHFNVWTLPDLLELMVRSQVDFALPFILEAVVSSENENILICRKRSSRYENAR